MTTKLFFEPRDIWIGVYWTSNRDTLKVYVCLVPCIPLLFTFKRGAAEIAALERGGKDGG